MSNSKIFASGCLEIIGPAVFSSKWIIFTNEHETQIKFPIKTEKQKLKDLVLQHAEPDVGFESVNVIKLALHGNLSYFTKFRLKH